MQQQRANANTKQAQLPQQRHWVEVNAEQNPTSQCKECTECPHDINKENIAPAQTGPKQDIANKENLAPKQDLAAKQDISAKQEQETAAKQPSLIEKTKDSVVSTFESAAFFIQHGATLNMPHDQQLRLAALLRQATMGDCSGQLPEKEDARETWQVWHSLNGTSRLDAMKEYVKLLTVAKADWEEAAANLKKTHSECREGEPCKKSEASSHIDIGEAVQKTLGTLKSTFDKCVQFVQSSLHLEAPFNNRAHLDALFKQATLGDCSGEQPENDNDKKVFKEWCNLKGMSNTEAMKQYLKALTSAKGDWEECERFASAAAHVSDLMNDLNIHEDISELDDTGIHGQALPAQAYIRGDLKAATKKECTSCDSENKASLASSGADELKECEKLACDAKRVGDLVKELNIKEEICDSCEGGEGKELPAEAYITDLAKGQQGLQAKSRAGTAQGKSGTSELNECEKFACEAKRVEGLLKELNIKEEICDSCEGEAKELPVRNQAGASRAKGQAGIAKGGEKLGANAELKECEKFANDAIKVSGLMKELNIKEEICGTCEGGEGKSLPADAYIRNAVDAGLGEQLAARREKELSQKDIF
jgi:acyl-CoA-binding protein